MVASVTALAACPYLAGCHPHHVTHIHQPGTLGGGLGILIGFVALGLLWDIARNGWNG